jgi:haloalkane dehalogenase
VFESWSKPFLVAFTDSDPVTKGGEQAFLTRVPNAQNVVVKGAGHFVQEDAGQPLARLMIDFMAQRQLPASITATRVE